MVSRLTKEQLGSLGRLIGFVGMHDLSNETVLHARFEIENALKYYQVARPYTYSNDLKQRIVAAVQQRQQEELQKTSQEQATSLQKAIPEATSLQKATPEAISLQKATPEATSLQKATHEATSSSATAATTTSEDQVDEQDDLQTMTSKLTIEQLETLSRLIEFVDVNDQFVTESSLRFKLQRALQYYNVPGPYIYSNDLKQRIVASVQQRQQEILKLQDQVAQRRRQAILLHAILGEQVLPAQEKEKEKEKELPKQKKIPIKIRLSYDDEDADFIYNEPLDLLTFELDKYDYDYSQPLFEARIREFLNQWFTEEPQEPADISILQPLSSEALENICQRKKRAIQNRKQFSGQLAQPQVPVQKIDDQATLIPVTLQSANVESTAFGVNELLVDIVYRYPLT
ncbi:MAG: hypothetical protein EZS28_009309, partial [Streblomastix strix]